MKHLARFVAIAMFVLPLVAFANITSSKHNLSAGGGQVVRAAAETQLCIFCHTPHKSLTQALLWQRATPAGTRGWTLGTTTLAGTPLPQDTQPGTKRCLSCHDGTIGVGAVNNVGGGSPGTITMDPANPAVRAGYLVGNGATAGNEMENTHPVSIPYAGQTYLTVVSSANPDGAIGNYFAPTNAGCTSATGFCTTGTNGAAITLYGTALGSLGVECDSCHEVHDKYDPNFYLLRVTSVGSALCLACHNK